LIEGNGPVVSRTDSQAQQSVIDELCEKVPNLRRAFYEDARPLEEFTAFGPLDFFKTMFLNGYTRLVDEIADRRSFQYWWEEYLTCLPHGL
jgi:hypothetical protein